MRQLRMSALARKADIRQSLSALKQLNLAAATGRAACAGFQSRLELIEHGRANSGEFDQPSSGKVVENGPQLRLANMNCEV